MKVAIVIEVPDDNDTTDLVRILSVHANGQKALDAAGPRGIVETWEVRE